MRSRSARGVGELVGSVICFLAVLGTLVAIDDRVGQRISAEISRDSIAGLSDRAGGVVNVILDVARDQSIEHAPLLVFSIVAVVLVLFMLRT